MDDPILEEMVDLCPPEQGEAQLRDILPPWQSNYCVDWTWHTPTVRLIIGRCTPKAPDGYDYPGWSWNALGGYAPTIVCASKVIGATVIDLLTRPELLEEARAEFEERTGGGIGGSSWVAPLLPKDFRPPVGFRWPEYVTTARGRSWYVPETA